MKRGLLILVLGLAGCTNTQMGMGIGVGPNGTTVTHGVSTQVGNVTIGAVR